MKTCTGRALSLVLALALLSAYGCGDDDVEFGGADAEFSYAFGSDAEGWAVAFSDLPVDYDPSIYELDSGHGPLPDGLQGSGIYVQGHNRSDDLFMFLKRQVGGLVPGETYAVSVSTDLATNVPAGSVGIGASPGSSVFVKAGASAPLSPTPWRTQTGTSGWTSTRGIRPGAVRP